MYVIILILCVAAQIITNDQLLLTMITFITLIFYKATYMCMLFENHQYIVAIINFNHCHICVHYYALYKVLMIGQSE